MKPGDIITVQEAGEDGETAALPTKLKHFEIVGRLGSGGMGLVFEARDTVLDRRVALKLLHPSTANGLVAPARLLREAQALAKLSHPNVVTVFEVGAVGEDRFIAMELVEGVTLLEWMATPRAWREVLDLFIGAGSGLAAVHALGLVHRDFKPSNVLVDQSGWPKLGDFGLVGVIDDPDAPLPPSNSDQGLTTPGAVMGTPAYMAPEQKNGEPVDARADQYSFAKSLREALGNDIPAALEPILARAMAEEPDDRYRAMEPLLSELARVRRGRKRTYLAVGAFAVIAIAIVAAFSVGRSQTAAADPCLAPKDRTDAIWGAPRRGALEAHLVKIDPTFGKQRFALATPVLDAGSARWQELHVETCQQSRDGRQSDAMLDRRMTCLERALFELDETIKALEAAADGKTLDGATRAATRLPTLDACADTAALADRVPLPANPSQRAELEALARETIDLDVAIRASGTKQLGDRAKQLVDRARALGNPDGLAAALQVLATSHRANELFRDETKVLAEAIVTAAGARDDRLLAELWSRQLEATVNAQSPDEAKLQLPAAEAANARISAPLELRAMFAAGKARVLATIREADKARTLLEPLIAEATTAKATTIAMQLKLAHAAVSEVSNNWPVLEPEVRALIPAVEAMYGKDHPAVGDVRRSLGISLFYQRKFAEAETEMREAIRIGEARLAPSPALARLYFSVGGVLMQLEKIAEGKPYMERALAMARDTMPPDDWRIAQYLIGLGTVSDDAGAKKNFLEARAILERGPRPNGVLASVLFNLGRLDHEQQKFDAALALYLLAVDEHMRLKREDKTQLALVNTAVAEMQYALKQFPAAVETSDRALQQTAQPVIKNQARYVHGMARARAGDAAGQTEAKEAAAALKKLGAPTPHLF